MVQDNATIERLAYFRAEKVCELYGNSADDARFSAKEPADMAFHRGRASAASEIRSRIANLDVAVSDDSMGIREVPWQPTEAMWGGLARQIMMWLDFGDKRTPRSLFRHLEMSGTEIPQWLRDEPEMRALDHVPSKGTRCAIIYKAMIEAHPTPSRA